MNSTGISRDLLRELVIESGPSALPIVVGSAMTLVGIRAIWKEYKFNPTCDEERSFRKPIILTAAGVVVLAVTAGYYAGLIPKPSAKMGEVVVETVLQSATKTVEAVKVLFNHTANRSSEVVEAVAKTLVNLSSQSTVEKVVQAVVAAPADPATQCTLVNGTMVDSSGFLDGNGFTTYLMMPEIRRIIPEVPPMPTSGLWNWAKRITGLS